MIRSNQQPRDLFGPSQATAIQDLLQSLFVAELICPSRKLWFAFGWISDIEILDNRSRQFSVLQPDWPAAMIRLSSVVEALLARGGSIAMVLRDVDHNRIFANKLAPLKEKFDQQLLYALEVDVHEKGLLGDDFLLSGSMNLTYNGITVNDEHLTLRTDKPSIEEWRLVLEKKWGGQLR